MRKALKCNKRLIHKAVAGFVRYYVAAIVSGCNIFLHMALMRRGRFGIAAANQRES